MEHQEDDCFASGIHRLAHFISKNVLHCRNILSNKIAAVQDCRLDLFIKMEAPRANEMTLSALFEKISKLVMQLTPFLYTQLKTCKSAAFENGNEMAVQFKNYRMGPFQKNSSAYQDKTLLPRNRSTIPHL